MNRILSLVRRCVEDYEMIAPNDRIAVGEMCIRDRPKNIISKDSLTRLKIYRGGEHEHAAQKPEIWAAE